MSTGAITEGGEVVESFAAIGVRAFTTGRADGSFGTASDEPVREVMARWSRLRHELGASGKRLATATQVHGAHVLTYESAWVGWLRGLDADGHVAPSRGMALAVTVADCVPVFIAHPAGLTAVLHSGWRGTAGRITEHALSLIEGYGLSARDLHLHCGPAICGKCYEVSPDVAAQLTGKPSDGPMYVDLRALIAEHAAARGVRRITVSPLCTRCDNSRFFSHRAGDPGRQIGVIAAGA